MPFQFITTVEQLRQLLPTAADVRLEFLQSYFSRASFQLLRPWLGQAVLDGLKAEVLSAEQLELLTILRPAVASYGYLLYSAEGSQTLTGQGPRRQATADQKPLDAKELTQHLDQLRASALAQLDEALIYLEEHPAAFPAWHASRHSTLNPGSFFTTADQLARYATGDWSRLRFMKVWPRLNLATTRTLRPLLGRELLARLLDEQNDTAHAEAIDLLRTALAGVALDDELALEAGHTAIDELRDLFQNALVQYPEFERSPSYSPPYALSDQSPYSFYSAY